MGAAGRGWTNGDGDQLSVTGPAGPGRCRRRHTTTSTQQERYPATAAYTTNYSYNDRSGWLRAQTSADNVKTSYTYKAVGQQASATDGANNITQCQYDAAGKGTSRNADGWAASGLTRATRKSGPHPDIR